ncbi:unnamed protein product [Discosporangium mesarthrocarpum]
MAQRAVARLATKLDAIKGTGRTIEIGEELRHLTLQVISEALMGLTPEESDETFAKVYMPIVVEGHMRVWNPAREFCPLLPGWWSHRRNTQRLNSFITGVIRRRWSLIQEVGVLKVVGVGGGAGGGGQGWAGETVLGSRRRQDILDKVLGSLEPGEWGTAAVRQIRDEMKTFVLAGHETSASMLNWALYELSRNGELHDKVVAESEAVFGRCASLTAPLPSVESLRELTLSEACLREALRKYSVVPLVVRKCVEATTISGGGDGKDHTLPRGTIVMLMIKGVHERPDVWPEPLDFKPERFLSDVKPYTFLPFIDGPRNCLGQHLSLLESKVVLSLLLNRYKFTLTNQNAGVANRWIIPTISLNGTHFSVEARTTG